MHLEALLSLLASFTVAVSARAVLSGRTRRGIDRADAEDNAIGYWREQSLPEVCFDYDQRAILQKWQRKFEGIMGREDSRLAA